MSSEDVPLITDAPLADTTKEASKSKPSINPAMKLYLQRPSGKRKITTASSQESHTKQAKLTSLYDILRKNVDRTFESASGSTIMHLDVQPDYRHSFLSDTHFIEQLFINLKEKDDPLISPCSLAAYLLALVYGHALINDIYGLRRTISDYGNEFNSDDLAKTFCNQLLSLNVPVFMEDTFQGLTPTCDPRRHNLQYTHNLGSYLFQYDFGRAIPISAFFIGHTLMAQYNPDVNPTDFFQNYLKQVLIRPNYGAPLRIANLFSAQTSQGTYESEILKALLSLFKPVFNYTNNNRPVFEEIPTCPFVSQLDNNINPYIYLLDFKENKARTLTILGEISSKIGIYTKCNRTLYDMIGLGNTTSIINHFYMHAQLPTWHPPCKESCDDKIDASQYARAIGFQQEQKKPTGKTTINRIDSTSSSLIRTLYLGEVREPSASRDKDKDADTTSVAEEEFEESDAIEEFDAYESLESTALFYQPWFQSDQTIGTSAIVGLKIETDRISGFHVPQPNVHASLSGENSSFLNSAVQAKNIVVPFFITCNTPYSHFPAGQQRRTQIARHVLGNPAIHRLPYFADSVRPHGNSYLPGFNVVANINSRLTSSSVLAQENLVTGKPTDSGWTVKAIYAWSSYRYFHDQGHINNDRADKVYFLLNQRTNYGTNVNLVRIADPLKLIPRPNDA